MLSGNNIRSAAAPAPWSTSFREAALLLLLAVMITAVSWALRADRLPLRADPIAYELELAAPLAAIGEALELYEDGEYIFVDTRPQVTGDFQTIPGSFFIRDASFDNDLLEYFDFMTTEDHFVLFGDGDLFPVSNIAARLTDRGYTHLMILKGGLAAWRSAGGEISERSEGGS